MDPVAAMDLVAVMDPVAMTAATRSGQRWRVVVQHGYIGTAIRHCFSATALIVAAFGFGLASAVSSFGPR